MHVQTVVGIADFPIETGEKITFGGENFTAAIEPVNNLRSVEGHHESPYLPQLRAGV
jgi:hypothetical protein